MIIDYDGGDDVDGDDDYIDDADDDDGDDDTQRWLIGPNWAPRLWMECTVGTFCAIQHSAWIW